MRNLHRALPQTFTPENLAKWITDNSKETINHTEKTDLDPEQIHDLEKQSSFASRSIDRLEEVKKEFMNYLKEGTPPKGGDGDDSHEPTAVDITIPPTKGLKALKANRLFADKQIENGYTEENIEIYMIPYPEEDLMVAVDIEGFEWPTYTRRMSIDEINQNKPILRETKKKEKPGSFLDKEVTDEEQLNF